MRTPREIHGTPLILRLFEIQTAFGWPLIKGESTVLHDAVAIQAEATRSSRSTSPKKEKKKRKNNVQTKTVHFQTRVDGAR